MTRIFPDRIIPSRLQSVLIREIRCSNTAGTIKKLHILYDADCAMCRQCRAFLLKQPAYFALEFVPLQTLDLESRFPGIGQFHPDRELIVITDEGGVYQGASAWIMCLYALPEYREWSQRLASPTLLPYAKKAVSVISSHRQALSRFFPKTESDMAILAAIQEPKPACSCAI